jgi:hypothetical protein
MTTQIDFDNQLPRCFARVLLKGETSIEPNDFKIVTLANSNHDILIKESLLIAQTKLWLNNNVRSFPLKHF